MNKKLKTILGIGAVLFLVVASIVYVKFFSSNTKFSKEELFVEIPTGSNYEDVKKIISPYVNGLSGFELMANLRSYDENVKPGRFLLKKGHGKFCNCCFVKTKCSSKIGF